MTRGRAEIPPKLSAEIRTVTFDFTSDLAAGETISTETVTASVYSGVDASPSAVISGSASASGAVVSQKVTGGVVGVMYELLCSITTSASQTLEKVGMMAVIPDVL